MMGAIIWAIGMGVVVYVMNEKEGLDYNPLIYALFTFLFGAIFGYAMYFGKYFKDKGGATASAISYIIALIFAVINVLAILGC